MLKRKVKKSSNYRIFRIFVIALAIFLASSFTISYALFNATLGQRGQVSVVLSDSDIVVTKVSNPVIHKDATVSQEASYQDNSVTFSILLNQTNATVTYHITIKNQGSANARFARVEETSSNDAVIYSLNGIDTSVILAPEEELEFELVIHYSDEFKYNFPDDRTDHTTLSFIFEPTLRNPIIPITGSILEDSGNVNDFSLGAKATITLRNDNDFAVEVTLSTYRSFTIYDRLGVERTFHLDENSENTFIIYIKDNDEAISSTGMNTELFILASVSDYGSIKTSEIDSINLTLDKKGKYQILAGGFTDLDDTVDFSTNATGSGKIYATKGLNDKNTYFFRGNINNNYFSFGGYEWRILRIDEGANIRLVLNDVLKDENNTAITQKYKNSNTASSLDEAKILVKMVNDKNSSDITSASGNSPLYGYVGDTSTTSLRGWYNNTFLNTPLEDYIVDSNFCQDVEAGTATSSGTAASVYYFGAYQKIGNDTALYEPSFDCPHENLFSDKVGTISAEEFVFAGGANKTSNNTFFLNDDGINNNYWTLSPSYYDPSLTTVGAYVVDTTGKLTDWLNGNTINAAYGMRPVITIKGTYPLSGSGIKTDPWKIEGLS